MRDPGSHGFGEWVSGRVGTGAPGGAAPMVQGPGRIPDPGTGQGFQRAISGVSRLGYRVRGSGELGLGLRGRAPGSGLRVRAPR